MTSDRRVIAALLRPLRGYAERITERVDSEARAAGLTVEVLARGRRRYGDPRLDQLAAHRAAAQYASVRNAARADDEAWSIPTLTTAAALVAVRRYPPASTTRPVVPVLPAGPAPPTSPEDRCTERSGLDSRKGPGRYQTRSPASSRPAQDRFQALRQERCAETILRSRLDPGHPAGPAPGALRAGSEEHAPARP
jgi:hypothetical protein